ncbi:MAG TPA: hypothetical protein VF520_00290 [Thermoleophilaceae bacterium]
MTKPVRTALLLAAMASLAVPAPAAASSKDVIKDCYEDGKLDGSYSRQDLKEAEEDLPSDVDEYSDCRSVIRAARARGKSGSGGGTGGVPGGGYGGGPGGDPSLTTKSGAIASSREDFDALDRQTKGFRGAAAPRVPVAGQPITPAAGAADVGRAANGLPTSLLAALAAVAAMCVAGTALALSRRRPRLRRVSLRLRRG